MGFLLLLIIAAIIGALGARLAGKSGMGCLTHIVLGFIGALIGSWLSRETRMDDLIYLFGMPVIWSVAGAALFVTVVSMFTGNRKSRK